MIGTLASRDTLGELADGSPRALLTVDASAALKWPELRPLFPSVNTMPSQIAMRYCLLSTLALLNSGCASESKKPEETVISKGIEMHRQSAGVPGNDGWYEAESTHGGFSVMLPAPFNDFTQTTTDGKFINYCVGTFTQDRVKYAAVLMTSTTDQLLPVAKDTFTANGSSIGKREVAWEGNSGIEQEIRSSKSQAKTRTFNVGNKRYCLIAEYPSDAPQEIVEDVDRFLGSLKSTGNVRVQ